MPSIGILECNRCRVQKLTDEAGKKGMTITMRKSLYGLNPKKKGVDIYIHPKSMEIPSHFAFEHDGDPAKATMMAEFLDEKDPEKWWEAWFPDIPSKCMCKAA